MRAFDWYLNNVGMWPARKHSEATSQSARRFWAFLVWPIWYVCVFMPTSPVFVVLLMAEIISEWRGAR